MKRFVSGLLIVIVLCLLLTVTVWANSPPTTTLDDLFSSQGLLHYFLYIGLSVAITVLIEWGIGLAFHFRHSRLVIITNIISQIVLQGITTLLTLSFMFTIFIPFTINIILLIEVFVVIGEWGIYCFVINDHSPGKVFLFTLCANLASFAAGAVLTLF